MENYQGINVSSGMGQGLAQVFDAYTPQYDLGEIGMVEYKNRVAQEEAARKKQEKLSKLSANIKTPLMPPSYLKLYKQKADDLLNAVKSGDEEGALRIKGEMENVGMLGKGIYDASNSRSMMVSQQPAGSFDGTEVFDEIFSDKKPLTMANLYDVSTDYMGRLEGIKRKEKPFDYVTEMNMLQNVVPMQQDQRRTYRDEAMAKEGVIRAVQFDPQWNSYAKAEFAKAAPQEQAKYKGDYSAWAADKYYKDLVFEKNTPEPKDTNISVNVGGGDIGTGVSDVAAQTYNMNLYNPITDKPTDYTMSFDADGFTFAPVEASRAVPSNTFDLNGKPYTKQGIVNMSIGAVVDMPVATKDVNIDGRPFKKGQPIPREYVRGMAKNPSKYKDSIGFKKMATALVDNEENVIFDLNEVENLIGTNQKWGIKGYGKYKENQTKMNTKKRYQQEFPNLFGGSVTPTNTNQSGGSKKTKEGKIDLSDF